MYNEISVKRCCRDNPELIENYNLAKWDRSQVYVIHHRLELTLNEEFAHTAEELKRLGMYFNRPYYELIFLPVSEHMSLHNKVQPKTFGRKKPD